MNPVAAQPSPGEAAAQLRPCVLNATPPRRADFLYPTWLLSLGDTRRPTRSRDAMPCRVGFHVKAQVKSHHPRDSFHAPDYLSRNITDPHEAGAPVPPLSAQAGATFHSIPLAGCPASLPPNLIKLINLAHALSPVGSGPRKTEPNSGGFAWPQELFAKS